MEPNQEEYFIVTDARYIPVKEGIGTKGLYETSLKNATPYYDKKVAEKKMKEITNMIKYKELIVRNDLQLPLRAVKVKKVLKMMVN